MQEAVAAEVSVRASAMVVLTTLWFATTALYASYHTVAFAFSLTLRLRRSPMPRNYKAVPPVALLYTTMNDLNEQSIASCLSQEYGRFHIFVLDDSTSEDERSRVDRLARIYGKRITVLRRTIRSGFKAGNLNHALRLIGEEFTYIAVVDADELLAPDFLRETVAIAEGTPNLAFVQAEHRTYAITNYSRQTGGAANLHWRYFLPARNRYGFLYSYGHGVLLRSRMVREVGGFPELVAEDIALAVRLREFGYRGYYAQDIVCAEESPPSYRAFRRRSRKVISGTVEFLSVMMPRLLRSRSVPWVEKLDALLAASLVLLPVSFLGFLSAWTLLAIVPWMPYEMPLFTPQGGLGDGLARSTLVMMHAPEVRAIAIFGVVGPLCYLVPALIRRPVHVLTYALRMTGLHLSLVVDATVTLLGCLYSRNASFPATGDRAPTEDDRGTSRINRIVGVVAICLGLVTGAVALVAVGLSLLLVPLLAARDLDGAALSGLILMPAILTIVAATTIPTTIIGAAGLCAGVALAHH
jgi:cellulose synthase/poly-beta-1,6-N-acetylglucosamine synthase-like glycosyltransferase